MKKLFALGMLILFAASVSIVAQQKDEMPGKMQGNHFMMNNMKKLNLNEDQQKQLKDIRYEQQKKMIDFRSQIQKNRLEIKNMMSNNNIDDKKLLELTDANSKIQGEIKSSRMKSWLAAYKILTPDQQKIWVKHFDMMGKGMRAKFMKNRMQHFEGRMEKFRNMKNMRKEKSNDEEAPMHKEMNNN